MGGFADQCSLRTFVRKEEEESGDDERKSSRRGGKVSRWFFPRVVGGEGYLVVPSACL